MNVEKELAGKNILVTGATSGIGYATVEYLIKCNANVIMVARNIEKMQAICNLYSNRVCYFSYNLENLEEIESIFEYVKQMGIKLDGMVHSAGMITNLPLKANDIDTMTQLMNINVLSFIELAKYFGLKKYSTNGSSIVALSSIVSLTLEKGRLLYATSKAALNAAIVVIAKELISRGIRVNAVLPGNVYTQMYQEQVIKIEGFEEKINMKQPLGIIEAEYVAELIGYLLSSCSKYMTGLTIPMDAGYLISE